MTKCQPVAINKKYNIVNIILINNDNNNNNNNNNNNRNSIEVDVDGVIIALLECQQQSFIYK